MLLTQNQIIDRIILGKIERYKDKWTPHLWANGQITLDMIEAMNALGIVTDYFALSSNPNITINYVLANLDKPWQWTMLTYNVGISIDDILANVTLPWDWFRVNCKPDLTLEKVLAHPGLPWNFNDISRVVTYEAFLQHPELPWSYEGLSANDNIPLDYVLEHRDHEWIWFSVSCYKVKNIEVVKAHMNNNDAVPWDWYGLTLNEHINFAIDIMTNKDLPWDWDAIIYNISVTLQDVLDHPELSWNWNALLNSNGNITIGMLFKHCPNINEVIENGFFPKRVTFKDLEKHRDLPWDWSHVSMMSSVFEVRQPEYNAYVEQYLKEYFAANKVKRSLKRSLSDPRYLMCRRRLLKECGELLRVFKR